MLEVNGLFVDIKGQPILKGVDFSVKGGELMGLLGPSGCGKSTLLKVVAGILPPKSGSILIGGEDMANVPPHKRGAVIVFQDMRLFPNMTALENVAFPIKMQGVPKRQRLEQAGQLMKSVQLCGLERAGSSSGLRLPARWRLSQGCCCWTSRLRRWIMSLRRKYARWCWNCIRSSGLLPCLSPTTGRRPSPWRTG